MHNDKNKKENNENRFKFYNFFWSFLPVLTHVISLFLSEYFTLKTTKDDIFWIGKIFYFFNYISAAVSLITLFWFFIRNYYLYFWKKNIESKIKIKKINNDLFILDFIASMLNLLIFIFFFCFGFILSMPRKEHWHIKLDFPLGKYLLLKEGKISEWWFYWIYQLLWHLISPFIILLFFFKEHSHDLYDKAKKNKRKIFDLLFWLSNFYHLSMVLRPFLISRERGKYWFLDGRTYPYFYQYYLIGFTLKETIDWKNFRKTKTEELKFIEQRFKNNFLLNSFAMILKNFLVFFIYRLIFEIVFKTLLFLNNIYKIFVNNNTKNNNKEMEFIINYERKYLL